MGNDFPLLLLFHPTFTSLSKVVISIAGIHYRWRNGNVDQQSHLSPGWSPNEAADIQSSD